MNLESIVKKLFLGGTLAVGVAVSMMTVGTYAANPNPCTGSSCYPDGVSSKTTFSLTVDKVLTITSIPTPSEIEARPGQVATGTFSVGVQTNSGYTISLKATKPNLTLNGGAATGNTDTEIAASSSVTGTLNTWGIKKLDSSNSATGNYVALTESDATFLDSAASAPTGRTSTFEIGVGTKPTLADGTYSTQVTVTAAVK